MFFIVCKDVEHINKYALALCYLSPGKIWGEPLKLGINSFKKFTLWITEGGSLKALDLSL